MNLNFSDLPWLPLEMADTFPRKPCIYFAVDSASQVQYVGRSINANNRWKDHHKYDSLSKLKRVKIYFLVLEAESFLAIVEDFFIKLFNPPLNIVGKLAVKSQPQPSQIQPQSDKSRISQKLAAKLKSSGKSWITHRELVNRSFSVVSDRKVAKAILENCVKSGKLEKKVNHNANGTISELYRVK